MRCGEAVDVELFWRIIGAVAAVGLLLWTFMWAALLAVGLRVSKLDDRLRMVEQRLAALRARKGDG